jgi:UDP-N-acetylmuramoyl-L-alanyl-D-glutamate--2,6-diaminopimelate ligase
VLFGAMLEAGDAACVMEVSSHAMSLHRADAVRWAAVAFTNLSRDHLDFHGSLEEYFQAKRLLIAAAPDRAVIDLDDEHGARLAAEFPAALTVSIDDPRAELRATNLRFDAAGTSFTLLAGNQRVETRVPLPGAFNVRNALTALGLAEQLGLPLAQTAGRLPGAPPVPGRMEPLDRGQPFAVAVDYAHTPDALERVLQAARELTEQRVICVFGCGGDRDRGKRPEMGAAAAAGADLVIVTSDNPRSEDPAAIIRDVLEGIDQPVTVQPDRREAISEAFSLAAPGDFVVIAGKGHEQGQQVGPTLLPFDDRVVAGELLEALVGRAPQAEDRAR